MDKQYLQVLSLLEKVKKEIEYVFDKADNDGFENKKAYHSLERTVEKLEDSILALKHFSKEKEGGRLYKLSNGRWAFSNGSGKEVSFSCGCPIEVYNESENEWQSGRIERKDGEYYFYNHDSEHLELYADMKVRIRINS